MANAKSTQRPHTKHIDPDEARRQLLAGLPVTERRLDLAGVSTAVLEGGDGPPLVLLHGPGGWAAHWMRVIPDLTTTHRIVVPDLPGHGTSTVDDGPLDAGRVVSWLSELIDATCTTRPVLVGHVLGGVIAARFASADPTRLSALVLVDTLGLRPFEPAPEFGHALEGYLAQPDAGTHDQLWRYCAFDIDALRRQMGDEWALFAAYNVDRARNPSVQSALHDMMGSLGLPAIDADVLARIAVPTSLVWGRRDIATPLSVAEDASARHGWPLHVIDGAADDPIIEQPVAFVRTLRKVLAAASAGIVSS